MSKFHSLPFLSLLLLVNLFPHFQVGYCSTYLRHPYSTIHHLTSFQQKSNHLPYAQHVNMNRMVGPEYLDKSNSKIVKKSEAVLGSNAWRQNNRRVEEHLLTTNETEDDELIDYFLEVLGPGLFLLPFTLAAIPLLLPAIPLSMILDRSPGEGDAKTQNLIDVENLVQKSY